MIGPTGCQGHDRNPVADLLTPGTAHFHDSALGGHGRPEFSDEVDKVEENSGRSGDHLSSEDRDAIIDLAGLFDGLYNRGCTGAPLRRRWRSSASPRPSAEGTGRYLAHWNGKAPIRSSS